LLDDPRSGEPLLELGDPGLEHGLLVLGRVVLGVLCDVSELACDLDPLGDLAPTRRREDLDLALERVVALSGQDDVLQLQPSEKKRIAAHPRRWRSAMVAPV